MIPRYSSSQDDPSGRAEDTGPGVGSCEDDLWFLSGPLEDGDSVFLPDAVHPQNESSILADWVRAEATLAAPLARAAGRLGALDDRLRRGPEGWRHRLALIEAADLSWFVGDRIAPDRLALWVALRLAGVQQDTAALARLGWAVRRLTDGPGPFAGLDTFLGRHDPENQDALADRFADRAGNWLDLMQAGDGMHPISRACMGYHLWSLAGLGSHGDQMEAAVTAARIAASEGASGGTGAVFAPLAMGGAIGLRASRSPAARLKRWLDGMETALLASMHHLDQVEAWDVRAQSVTASLSGRTPPALRTVLTAWPLVSAPMAEALTGASRAAVQRNLAWLEARGLIREVTGQGRFRFWRCAL